MRIRWVLAFVLAMSASRSLETAASPTPQVISESAQTPTSTSQPTVTPSPKPSPAATSQPTPKPSPASTTPKPTAKPTATPTPQSTSVQLFERASYIGTCRSSGATSLKVYADTAQTQVVSEVPPESKLTLTGVLGEGLAQISQPSVGWVKAASLLTDCAARPKAP